MLLKTTCRCCCSGLPLLLMTLLAAAINVSRAAVCRAAHQQRKLPKHVATLQQRHVHQLAAAAWRLPYRHCALSMQQARDGHHLRAPSSASRLLLDALLLDAACWDAGRSASRQTHTSPARMKHSSCGPGTAAAAAAAATAGRNCCSRAVCRGCYTSPAACVVPAVPSRAPAAVPPAHAATAPHRRRSARVL